MMKFSHTRLLVSDFDACFRFYRDIIGFRPTWGQEGETYASFDDGSGGGLTLFARDEMAAALGTEALPAGPAVQDRVAFIVESEDVDADVAAMRQRGARFPAEPVDRPEWGIRVAYLRDPEGTLIELNRQLPQEEWTADICGVAETGGTHEEAVLA
jgi:catechol 2,3-dioxygenase-like lactoylglutathione lyase family enzyme